MREFLSHHGVSFTENFVDKDPEALEAFKKTGSRGTPTILVGDETVIGFDRGRLEQLLGIN
ncbi:MAG TPA: glutaredoxin family protein [Nitrospinae bacterium]|nr:glutaredoxin family protein [Nitrospinota bacterium]